MVQLVGVLLYMGYRRTRDTMRATEAVAAGFGWGQQQGQRGASGWRYQGHEVRSWKLMR